MQFAFGSRDFTSFPWRSSIVEDGNINSAFGEISTLENLPLPRYVPPRTKRRLEPMPLLAAIRRLKEGKAAKFDETVEITLNTGVDPRRGDQMVRGVASLPHGTGKRLRICVFALGEDADAALKAGADIIGDESMVNRIQQEGGSGLNFDACLATPEMMPKLGKIARILGPRGLMPNPKLGTVTKNISEGVEAIKRGRVEFRVDKGAVLHAGIGKRSFSDEKLVENVEAFIAAVLESRPKGIKGSGMAGYILKAYLSSTMGPSYPVALQSLAKV